VDRHPDIILVKQYYKGVHQCLFTQYRGVVEDYKQTLHRPFFMEENQPQSTQYREEEVPLKAFGKMLQ
jgi:hypothetical protein